MFAVVGEEGPVFTILFALMSGVFFWAAYYNWRLAVQKRDNLSRELYFYVGTSACGGLFTALAVALDISGVRFTDAQALVAIVCILGEFGIWLWLYKPATPLSGAVTDMTGAMNQRSVLRVVVPLATILLGLLLLVLSSGPHPINRSSDLRPLAPYMVVGAVGGAIVVAYTLGQTCRRFIRSIRAHSMTEKL
jgi:hypothetical protein